MHGLQIAHVLSVTALLSVAGGCVPASSSKSVPATDAVVPWRVPDGGRLPHAVIDDEGTTHLVYLKGEPVEGDLMYVTRGPGATTWSEPAQVNSEPGTVTGIGPIDGGHLAQGRDTCHMPGARDQKSWDAGLKRIALVRSTRAWYSCGTGGSYGRVLDGSTTPGAARCGRGVTVGLLRPRVSLDT